MKANKVTLPPLKTLPAFVAVAKHLNFSKAAEELFVTHSAVSQSIRSLEEFLGVKLFVRTPNKQTQLTPQGDRYFKAIQPAMNSIIAATKIELGVSSNNVLTVNVLNTLTMRWLIPRLPLFQDKYPDIDLRLATLGIDVDFIQDNIDINVTYGRKEDYTDLYCKKLFDDELVLVANPKLISKKLTLELLLQNYKAIYVDSPLRTNDWRDWCAAFNISEPKKYQRMTFQSSSQAIQAVNSGLGIMVTHKPFIMDDLSSGNLNLVSAPLIVNDKAYYLVCSKEKLELSKVSSFCKWINKQAMQNQLKT